MGCLYDIYIEFLAYAIFHSCIIKILRICWTLVFGLMEVLILGSEGHSTVYFPSDFEATADCWLKHSQTSV